MRRLRAGLVVAQMACCSVLVIGAGLLLKGFRSALQTSVGQSLGQPILATAYAKFGFDRPDLGLRYFDDLEQAGTIAAWRFIDDVGLRAAGRAAGMAIDAHRTAADAAA